MADAPGDELYLFLSSARAEFQPRGGIWSTELPSTQATYFWSFNRDGSNPLPADRALLGEEEDYQLIHDYCVARGPDPQSTQRATQLGYPAIAVGESLSEVPWTVNEREPNLKSFPVPSPWCWRCLDIEKVKTSLQTDFKLPLAPVGEAFGRDSHNQEI
ncbi:hypothetical protein B0H19DRAFT_1252920 [Mycena capillaripes]|nr:hypothetical protein B0H19DRAFT_1252920 [Mycena capillaripes]